jgi:four helix bundle protein
MRSLENLDVYRLARELAVDVYRMTRDRPLSAHLLLANQIGRAVISIPANIAEGYVLGTRAQFVRGVRIAFGSAAELDTHLWVARRAEAPPQGRHRTTAVARCALHPARSFCTRHGHSYLNASTGSSLAARFAGSSPKISPIATETAVAIMALQTGTPASNRSNALTP